MWNRVDLKARGKEAFRKNYWASVAVALLSGLVSTVSASSGRNAVDTGSSTSGYAQYYGGNMFSSLFAGVLTATLVVLGIFLVVLRIFIGNLLEIGGCRFFLANQQEQPRVSKMFEVFKGGNYGNQVLTMFLMNLYVFLWSLLLIVPGIIKGYEYRMVPYILAENPDMDRKEVFLISKRMMDGKKMAAFVLDLSFIGWVILGTITCGIVNLFYVSPYMQATNAEMYTANREIAYEEGYIR